MRAAAELQPLRLIQLVDDCERDLPPTVRQTELRRQALGAGRVIVAFRSAGLSLEVFDDGAADEIRRGMLSRVARGDSEAAYELSNWYRAVGASSGQAPRRGEQWLRIAAELGHSQASWEIAQVYNQDGLVGEAARFEKRALELGYRPGTRLPTRGY